MNDLIIIEQLPIIKERLASVSEEIEKKTAEALAMICTEETVKTVKALRADLNKEFKTLEDQRKTVKEAVMKPYDEFDQLYKDLISSKFKAADAELSSKITEVESALKEAREKEVRAYYDEYAASLHISGYSFDRAGVNVTLSASLKSLKDAAKAFADRVYSDLLLIGTQEYSAEILVEYQKSLNASEAIRLVIDRHLAIEEEKRKEAERAAITKTETVAVEAVDAFLPPPEVIAEPPKKTQLFTTTFRVTGSKDQLIALRDYLKNGGYKYEQQ